MNLLQFLLLIVKYQIHPMESYRKGYLVEIKEMLDHAGSVWQKFAQTLAQMDFIIGKELALGLESLYCDCTPHPHEYSKSTILDEFGDKYDVSDMKYIGSGSVAQTYKVKLRNEAT